MSKFPVHVLDPLESKATLFLIRFFCAWLAVGYFAESYWSKRSVAAINELD